ncbi:MAG: restriction endonuclease [Chitinophagales bacterium]|nr:restriction endonuclease [Chitinophagales bacterium]
MVTFIKHLDKNNLYHYVSNRNKGQIKILSIDGPEGPIRVKRWNAEKGESEGTAEEVSISTEMIWRIANAFSPLRPINFDRVLGASYNTRSVLEALIVHTPQFYYCYPGRVENIAGKTKIKHGHKHVLWNPDNVHKNGIATPIDTDIVISEIVQQDAIYDSLDIPIELLKGEIDIDIKRRHSQIQIALYFIGKQLGYSTWIARNDRSIEYKDKKISEYEGVIASLNEGTVIRSMSEAVKAAALIDCIWFKNGKLMPAVMEIEHSTGVTSGLSRMQEFYDMVPSIKTRYVIVAPDEEREKVIKEINKEQFKPLNAQYFPYSSVEELYNLCQRRKLKGVTEDFLDCYMESVMMT